MQYVPPVLHLTGCSLDLSVASPGPGLTLALAHSRGEGYVAQLVEAARHEAGEAGAHVQGPVAVVRHQADVLQLVLDGGGQGAGGVKDAGF